MSNIYSKFILPVQIMWPVACNDCYWYITNLIICYLQQNFCMPVIINLVWV